MQTNETHQEPKAHITYTRLMVMILVYLAILACAVAIIRYSISQEVIGGPGVDSEMLTLTSYQWAPGGTSITITVKNTGPATLTMANVEVDGVTAKNYTVTVGGAAQTTLTKGTTARIVITQTFYSGVVYNFMAVTAKGSQFGPYTLTAP
jgi:hypothetical protein